MEVRNRSEATEMSHARNDSEQDKGGNYGMDKNDQVRDTFWKYNPLGLLMDCHVGSKKKRESRTWCFGSTPVWMVSVITLG